MSKTGTCHVFSGLDRAFPNFVFWPILTLQKVFLGHFSRSLRKSKLKTCIAALNHEFFCLTFFTWWPEMPWPVLWSQSTGNDTDVSDTIHADSLALFALNIEILLTDVTKPEKFKVLTLTWPVTSSVTSGSIFFDLVRVVHVQGYQMVFEILKSVQ